MNKKVVITGLTLATFALSATAAEAADFFKLDQANSFSTFQGEGGCGEGSCGEGKCGGSDKGDEKKEEKKGEGNCGEGSCGEKKTEDKKK